MNPPRKVAHRSTLIGIGVLVSLLILKLNLQENNENDKNPVPKHKEPISASVSPKKESVAEIKELSKKKIPQIMEFSEPALNTLAKELEDTRRYSIILYEMDSVAKKTHTYHVIKQEGDSIVETISPEYNVSDSFYNRHKGNLGMTIAAKGKDGGLDETPSPAGYYNFIDDNEYGAWVENDRGERMWHFNEKHAFMLLMLGYRDRYHIYDQRYRDYRTHHNSGRTYYGVNTLFNVQSYGTRGSTSKHFYGQPAKNKREAFRQRVRQRINRSSVTSSRTYQRTSSGSSTPNTSSRTGTRYNSGSSGRSSGGGYGK